MITSRQVRAARALLGWTQEMLADKALVALTALKRLESDPLKVREDTRHRVASARRDALIARSLRLSGSPRRGFGRFPEGHHPKRLVLLVSSQTSSTPLV